MSEGPHLTFRPRGQSEEDRLEHAELIAKIKEEDAYFRSKMNPERPFDKVKQFHESYGQPVGDEPRFLTPERQELRERLIDEEVKEFKEAVAEGDLVNAFKELADIIYVVEGTAVEMGGDLDKVFAEVHRSNMSKLDADGKPIYREDGKVLKGPNYREPNVRAILDL